jgi:hypothetical protein
MIYLKKYIWEYILGKGCFFRKLLFGQSGPERGRNCLLGPKDHIEDIWLPFYRSKPFSAALKYLHLKQILFAPVGV